MSDSTDTPISKVSENAKKRPWYARRGVLIGGVIVVILLIYGASGASTGNKAPARSASGNSQSGSSSKTSNQPSSSKAKSKSSNTASKQSPSSGNAGIGSSRVVSNASGVNYKVTLTGIQDPATPASSFDTPSSGDKLVAVTFTISATGGGALNGDALLDASIQGTDGQAHQPSINSVAGCTTFNAGSYTIPAGGSESGCVVFEVPTSVKVAEVQWTPSGGFASSFVTWKVQPPA